MLRPVGDGLGARTAAPSGAAGDGPARHAAANGLAPPADPDQDVVAAVAAVLVQRLTAWRQEAARLSGRFEAELAARVAQVALSGGKRLRPAFVWWGWRAGGGGAVGPDAQATLRVAAAVELLQACAIIHDDLMDEAALRRGADSTHVAFARRHRAAAWRGSPDSFGAAAALLAGDLALVWADDLWESAAASPAAAARSRPVWQAMRGEMVAGQYLDLRAQAAGEHDVEQALRVASLKSARYTVERPLHLGASLAGAPPPVVAALRRAGRQAGLAFQLGDDFADVFGGGADGKPTGADIRQGKATYLLAVALRRAREHGRADAVRELRAAVGAADRSAVTLDRVRAVLVELGAAAEVRRQVQRLTADAVAVLRTAGLAPAAVEPLVRLVRGFADRVASAPEPGTAR